MKLELVLDEVALPWEPAPDWERSVERMVSGPAGAVAELQVVLSDDETLREHNREYRARDEATDVLSFSYLDGHEDSRSALLRGDVQPTDFLDEPVIEGESPLIGQVLVSVEMVVRRGAVHGVALDDEMAFMVAHGLLHVLGFDHVTPEEAREMRDEERVLMDGAGFRLRDDYLERGGSMS